MRTRRFIAVAFLSVVAALSFTQPGFARHHVTSQTVNTDPCAAPHGYVRERIARIKALQASVPKTNATLFEVLGGRKDFDTKTSVEISELRYEADGVNALLAAGGCQAFDIDRELASTAK